MLPLQLKHITSAALPDAVLFPLQEKPLDSMHNSTSALAFVSASVSLNASVSLAYPPDARLLIKHSEVVQLNCFFSLSASPVYIVFRGS